MEAVTRNPTLDSRWREANKLDGRAEAHHATCPCMYVCEDVTQEMYQARLGAQQGSSFPGLLTTDHSALSGSICFNPLVSKEIAQNTRLMKIPESTPELKNPGAQLDTLVPHASHVSAAQSALTEQVLVSASPDQIVADSPC